MQKPILAWEAGNRRYDADAAYTMAASAQLVLHLVETQQLYPSHPALQRLQNCIDDVGYRVGLLGLAPTTTGYATYHADLIAHVRPQKEQ